ncbi:MAG: GPW/gp25 family protein [Cyanobacteriota bacterium]|nr:GPW/gp25 family protein [Cyanobacteriota bacterium]
MGSPLGSGWSFPPSFDRFSGNVKLTSDVDNVRENLHVLFSTDVGERIMLSNYGTPLRQHLFGALTETTSHQLKLEIRNVIMEWEPRIDVLDIQINNRQELHGRFELFVEFQLRITGARGSMIYPFYLEEDGPPPPNI